MAESIARGVWFVLVFSKQRFLLECPVLVQAEAVMPVPLKILKVADFGGHRLNVQAQYMRSTYIPGSICL